MLLAANPTETTSKLKRIVKNFVPAPALKFLNRIFSWLRLFLDYFYDCTRFIRYRNNCKNIEAMDQEKATMHLLRLMHSLEKGLSLPNPEPGFGKQKAQNLAQESNKYLEKFGDDEIYRLCNKVLLVHQQFQEKTNGDHCRLPIAELEVKSKNIQAGARSVTRNEIWRYAKIDFDTFSKWRFSTRCFTGDDVNESDLIDAIRIAMKSPSVCNRGCGRAYYSVNRNVIKNALSLQGGNRGFGHLAGGLIIVAADTRAFYKTGERNQGWIDGGLFAMSLNYALHSKGYGVCMLNWSKDLQQDLRLRKEFQIQKEHQIVMLMAVGHLPEELMVAESPRRSVKSSAIELKYRSPIK